MLIPRRTILGAATGAALLPRQAIGQSGTTLRLVVPFPAGGAIDANARLFAEACRSATGRNCIVENKPGASTIIASVDVSRAAPDGRALLWTTGGHTTNAVLMKRLPFDPLEDFTPLTRLTLSPGFVLAVGANSPYKTLQQVLQAARAAPGRLTYGSAGNGNTTHVVGALFAKSAGIDLLHVPYKGTPLNDLMAGFVDMTFIAPTIVMSYLQSGKMRALGLAGARRAALLPEVPTFAEAGVNSPDIPSWSGLLAPPKMPPAVLQALYDDVMKAARMPAFETAMKDQGSDIDGMAPAPFRNYIVSEIERYKRVLPPLGIQMDA